MRAIAPGGVDGRRGAPIAAALAGAGLGLCLAAVVALVAETAIAGLPPLDGNTVGGYALAATFPIVGWVIASRQPRNAIGWIFLVIGLSQALSTFADLYATFGTVARTAAPPFAAEFAWAGTWAWAPGYVLLLTLSVLLFPDGRLPSPRWRPLAWATAVALVLIVVPTAIAVWPVRSAGLAAAPPPTDSLLATAFAIQGAGLALAAVTALGCVAGLLVRFRRAHGIERRQLQWFAFAGAVEVTAIAVTPLLDFGDASGPFNVVVALVVAPLLPIAAAVAILRYRLYEIDRIVSRTISYALVTAALGAVFGASVLVLQGAVAPLTGGDGLTVAVSTLIVAALFQPVRARVQTVVDGRFNRRRYDVEREVAAFVARARAEVEIDRLAAALATTLDRTMQPASSAVWVRRPPVASARDPQPRVVGR